MRFPVAAAALGVAFVVTSSAGGTGPALAQDFSITNPAEPGHAVRRNLLRDLQAWWESHAYYPRRASQNDEGGTVTVRLVIRPDGTIWTAAVVESSGSASLDAAAGATFHGGFVRAFPAGEPEARLDVSLHYVLAHRRDQTVVAGPVPAASKRGFTITNEPVQSPILAKMLQRTCTGLVVKEGIRNHPMYGVRHWAQAIFFRTPDGRPWVRYSEAAGTLMAPVSEAGNMVQWTGREEHPKRNVAFNYQFTVWPDGEDRFVGNIEAHFFTTGLAQGVNTGGTVDFSCSTEVVPAITWHSLFVDVNQVAPIDPP